MEVVEKRCIDSGQKALQILINAFECKLGEWVGAEVGLLGRGEIEGDGNVR